jgi:hypothetical protein
MPKLFAITVILLYFTFDSNAQTQAYVHLHLLAIKDVPQRYKIENTSSKWPDKKYFKSKDTSYKAIVKLDTLAIPYLINELNDTLITTIINCCTKKPFKIGDIAYCLLNDIVKDLPMHLITGSQWDLLTFCGGVQDGVWEYLSISRLRYQQELREFFNGEKGEIWLHIMKGRSSSAELDKFLKAYAY